MTETLDIQAHTVLGEPKRRAADRLEEVLLTLPDKIFADAVPLKHYFAPGVYIREIYMSAGQILVGHEHKTEHFNVVLTGRATVHIDGKTQEIVAPCIFVSEPGVRKALHIHEDMRWATVHLNPEDVNDVERLEEILIVKSPIFKEYEAKRLLEPSQKEIK